MKMLILFASPRPEGNTAQLLNDVTKGFDNSIALLSTFGYPGEKAPDLLTEGLTPTRSTTN